MVCLVVVTRKRKFHGQVPEWETCFVDLQREASEEENRTVYR